MRAEAGRGGESPPLLAALFLRVPGEDAAAGSDARRAGTCCSLMIRPRSAAVALTLQDAVATVTAASPAAAAAAATAASAGPASAPTSPA